MKASEEALRTFRRLAQKLKTPERVQNYIRNFSYNYEKDGPSCRSAFSVYKRKRAHCLEAAFLAAAILEHRGYPPIVLSLDSKDNLDHVLYIFQERGKWGAVGLSRDEGLLGRAPVFKNVREMVESYFDPYIDEAGMIQGYGVYNLDDSATRWRDSTRSVWKAERALIQLKHTPYRMPKNRYEKVKAHFLAGKKVSPKSYWW